MSEAPSTVDQRGIGNYEFIRRLGSGTYGIVKLARHIRTGLEVAIKIIDKTVLNPRQLSKLSREVRLMKKLDHPHIVKLFEVLETSDVLYLVMEYCAGGELYDYLIAHGKMKESVARVKFLQLFSALHYCHTNRVIHRDLKAENLLLDEFFNIKIADFGLGNFYDPEGVLDTYCGSPQYAAPELFLTKKYTGPEVDIWALGIILYVMATSCLPFSGRDFADMKMVVCAGRFIIPDHVSPGLQTLLRRLIILNPSQRASLNLFMDDPWLNAEGDARAELRKIYDFELLVGPTDHQVMPELDDAIVQIMIRKYKFEEQEILASFAANNFDEITTVYRLLWSEKQRKPPVPARSLALPQPTPPVRVRPSIASKRSVSSATLFDKKDNNSSSTQQIQPLSPFTIPNPTPELIVNLVNDFDHDSPSEDRRTLHEEEPNSFMPSRSPSPSPSPSPTPQQDRDHRGKFIPSRTPSPNVDPDASSPPRDSLGELKSLQESYPRLRNRRRSSSLSDMPNLELMKRLKARVAVTIDKSDRKPSTLAVPAVPRPSHSRTRSETHSEMAGTISPATKNAARSRVVLPPMMINGNSTSPETSPNMNRKGSDKSERGTPTGTPTTGTPTTGTPTCTPPSTPPGFANLGRSFFGSFKNSRKDEATSPGGITVKPRILRFTFSSATTSALPPDQIQEQVLSACESLSVKGEVTAPFLVAVEGSCKMEVEVCLLPRLRNLHGLRFKRLNGSSADYKELCEKLLSSLKL